MTTGGEELVFQTANEPRFVVDCKVNPVGVIGQVKTTFAAEGIMVNCGGSSKMVSRKTVPAPPTPLEVVP